MRSVYIGVLFGISTIGFLGLMPSQARAQMPMSMIRLNNNPPVTSGTIHLNPYYRMYARPLGVGGISAGPASYSFINSANFASGMLLTRSVVSWAYSPFYGPSWWYTTPSMIGWTWTPALGYTSYVIPGRTAVVSPYLAGYLPADFVVP